VPSNFVLLETMPLSSNGKVDRKALPAPDQSRLEDRGTYVAPRRPEEELLASIWSDVLRLERVGIRDDFFDLGGHSLNATQVVSRVREAFKVEMPLRTLFEFPTVESLARAITTMTRSGAGQEIPPIVPVSREQQVPLSFAQQRLWFLDQMDPGNHLYNIPRAFRLAGTLDLPALQRALNDLVARHEILRTNYQLGGADEPVQIIAPKLTIELPVMDLSGMGDLRREEEAQRIVQQETDRGFDLARDPMLRALLLRLAETEHVLFMNMHHIASDGWSSGVMLNDLCSFYGAAVAGGPAPLPSLAIQYADYSFWQRQWLQGEVLEKQLGYWKAQLAGAPAVLALPTDQARPPVQTYRGAMLETTVPKGITEGLKALGRQQGATMFMTMLAGFECLMHYSTGQSDIVLGTDLANRTSVESEALIGFFVNLLPLRVDVSGDPTFVELMGRVREVSLNAYAHQDVPFDKLVEELKPERNLSYSPLVQVLFVQQNTPRATATMPGIEMSRFKMQMQSKFDMAVFTRETGGEVASSWQYNPDLFDENTIARLASSYEALLQSAVSNPKARVSSLCELLAEADRTRRGSEQVKVQKAGLEKLKAIRRKAVADG
jgi:acyl carrier protein